MQAVVEGTYKLSQFSCIHAWLRDTWYFSQWRIGGREAPGSHIPTRSKFFSFLCSFRQKCCKKNRLTPPTKKSPIRHCFLQSIRMLFFQVSCLRWGWAEVLRKLVPWQRDTMTRTEIHLPGQAVVTVINKSKRWCCSAVRIAVLLAI